MCGERRGEGCDLVGEEVQGIVAPFRYAADHSVLVPLTVRRYRSHVAMEQTMFSMPVSSSRLRNVNPPAVPGRCRWRDVPGDGDTPPVQIPADAGDRHDPVPVQLRAEMSDGCWSGAIRVASRSGGHR